MSDALLLALPVLLPTAAFAVLGLAWLLGFEPGEKTVARLTTGCWTAVTLAGVALAWRTLPEGASIPRADYGDWLTVAGAHFPLTLRTDALSIVMLLLASVLIGVVSIFSRRYLHRDTGYRRFFSILNLYGAGLSLLFTAESFDLMAVGWEFICTTSFLLIAFYQHREGPARGALRAYGVFRGCDIGLFAGVALLHAHPGVPEGRLATAVAFLFLVAAMGKSAQFPFSGWLPRAMEGPTPSSAIFYGALSVHAGAYLLLRARPILDAATGVSGAIVAIGALTALQGALVGRAASDAKSSLAYATMTQLGLVFVEIGFGWDELALWHIAGHAILRTAQFLRAPSMLHDHHLLHSASGGHLHAAGAPFGSALPASLQKWLYGFVLDLRGKGIA